MFPRSVPSTPNVLHRRLASPICESWSAAVRGAANWPGNVRQLRHVSERLVVTVSGDIIAASDLPADLGATTSSSCALIRSLAEATEAAEKDTISIALVTNEFHRENTAKILGVRVRMLHYKMNRYGLH